MNLKYFLIIWFFSINHKDIGTLYFILGDFSGVLDMWFSALIRLNLSNALQTFFDWKHFFLLFFPNKSVINCSLTHKIKIVDSAIIFDVPVESVIDFKPSLVPIMEGVIDLHHDILFVVIFTSMHLSFIVAKEWLLNDHRSRLDYVSSTNNSNEVETFWTIVPTLSLILVSIPAFCLLYVVDAVDHPTLTIKSIGHQFYWSYDFNPLDKASIVSKQPLFNYDRMLLSDKAIYKLFKHMLYLNKYNSTFNNDSPLGGFYRLLYVNKGLILPVKTHINILLASNDVLHIRIIPIVGTDLETCQFRLVICQGRLNDFGAHLNSEGTFYGPCSEFFGKNHKFTTYSSYNIGSYIRVVNLNFRKDLI